MTAADDAALLCDFRLLLDEYEALSSLMGGKHWNPEDGQRIDQLEAQMGEALERVRELVERAVPVENLEDRWNDGGWVHPFEALFRVPQLTREIKRLVNRSIGVYKSGGPRRAVHDLSLPDLAFVTDVELRRVLERNLGELGHAMSSHSWTSAIVLAGSVAEGVLYFILRQRQADATTAAAAVVARSGGRKRIQGPIEEWKLWAYIDVADEMKILKGTTSAIAHGVLRDFRNMVHPWVQIRDALEPTETAAQGSVVYLRSVIRDAVTALPSTTGPTSIAPVK